ncbi:hypothetical protein Tco_0072856 [Tanacetum coccineum]
MLHHKSTIFMALHLNCVRCLCELDSLNPFVAMEQKEITSLSNFDEDIGKGYGNAPWICSLPMSSWQLFLCSYLATILSPLESISVKLEFHGETMAERVEIAWRLWFEGLMEPKTYYKDNFYLSRLSAPALDDPQ